LMTVDLKPPHQGQASLSWVMVPDAPPTIPREHQLPRSDRPAVGLRSPRH
jgi:hypothetical protein